MHATKVKPTILGGVSRGFRSRFLDSGAQSTFFYHLKKCTLDKSVHFWVPSVFEGPSVPMLKEVFRNVPNSYTEKSESGFADVAVREYQYRDLVRMSKERKSEVLSQLDVDWQ